jgi:hypothetical protein
MYILLYGLKNIQVGEYPPWVLSIERRAAYGRTVGAR